MTFAVTPMRLTIRQACQALCLSRTTLNERIAAGKIKFGRDGSRRFVSHEEIARYLAACEADT